MINCQIHRTEKAARQKNTKSEWKYRCFNIFLLSEKQKSKDKSKNLGWGGGGGNCRLRHPVEPRLYNMGKCLFFIFLKNLAIGDHWGPTISS